MLLRGECGTTPNARVFRHVFRVTRKHCACTSNRYSLSPPPLPLSHSQIQTLSVFFNLLFVFHSSTFMATRRVINRSYTAVYSVHLIGPYNSQLTLCLFCNEFYSFSFRPVPRCVFAQFLFACLSTVYLFIRGLFNDAVFAPASNEWTKLNYEMERLRKRAVVT